MPDHFIVVVVAVSSKAEMNASRMRIVSRPIKERRFRRSIPSAPGVRCAVEQVQNVALEASVFSLPWFDLRRKAAAAVPALCTCSCGFLFLPNVSYQSLL